MFGRLRTCFTAVVERVAVSTRGQGALTLAVIALVPVYIFAGWLTSIPALAIVTLATWVDGRVNSWIGARIARKQQEDADVSEVKELIENKL
jgi:ABC-type protease/lipase transport system fused ATPase/permease subunit